MGARSKTQTFDPATNTFTLTTPLTDGTHTITSTVTNAVDLESAPSLSLSVHIDTASPGSP